ncbi:hypothetical protein K435DRAFT_860000 [Dendrothele bispora CBS 962.96]|uniref:Uncharacterized protein n=1 Tax=Dendrothele bispora (strain CBS 962.96) TaxID=1314807 RepID=A0A4S8LZG3_DENBC|nr:hypothetical protein K435DRAFT_860000 [Dendrothele bispora CBS 962.96]
MHVLTSSFCCISSSQGLVESFLRALFSPAYRHSPEKAAKAKILRVRVRMRPDALFGVHEDLHAALPAEQDNSEAKTLLYQRLVKRRKASLFKSWKSFVPIDSKYQIKHLTIQTLVFSFSIPCFFISVDIKYIQTTTIFSLHGVP